MRLILFSLMSMMVAGGCRCSPATPQPVTMRVVNTTRSPTVFSVRQTSSGMDREQYRFFIPSLGVHGEF